MVSCTATHLSPNRLNAIFNNPRNANAGFSTPGPGLSSIVKVARAAAGFVVSVVCMAVIVEVAPAVTPAP
jgi:hypothetical protein